MNATIHVPVMANEMLEHLDVRKGGVYFDGTLGGGGMTALILERGGDVVAMDRDPDALSRAQTRFPREIQEGRLRLAHANHADLRAVASDAGCHEAAGVVLDLGLSSDQLEDPAKGFSLLPQNDAALDMRMNPADPVSAADIVATATEEELAEIFRELGEEPQAKKFARAIVRAREQSPETMTTARLAAIVESAAAGRRPCGKARHPATRVFQALRMRVNDELGSLESALEAGIALLAPGHGRMVVIAFESLTARCVKLAFQRHAGRFVSLQQGGSRWEGEAPVVELLTRHAVAPSEAECRANPRARSAKLRAVRRMGAAETQGFFESNNGVVP